MADKEYQDTEQQLCHSRSTWVNDILLFRPRAGRVDPAGSQNHPNTIDTKLSRITEVRCLHRVQGIPKDNTDTSHGPFTLLPSDKWYRSTYCQTTRLNTLSTRITCLHCTCSVFLGSTFFIILTVDSEEDDRKRREEGYDMHKGSMLKLNLRCWISLSPGPFGYQSTPCFKFFTIMVLMRHKFPVETGRTHLKTQGKQLGTYHWRC